MGVVRKVRKVVREEAMKPSDGEVEFLRSVELRLGAGTRARVANIEAKRRERGTEIVATVEVRATVTMGDAGNVGTLARCDACGADAPPPDDDGLWYILQNHDGDRIVCPVPEAEANADPERDQYPAPGWMRIGDGKVCGECYAAAQKALKGRKRKP